MEDSGDKIDKEKIRREGIKIIEEFSKMLEKIPEIKETHYVGDIRNRTREDREPIPKKEFPDRLKRIAPWWDNGFIVAEKNL